MRYSWLPGRVRVCLFALFTAVGLFLFVPSAGADCATATTSGAPACQDVALAGSTATDLEVLFVLVALACGSVCAAAWLGRR